MILKTQVILPYTTLLPRDLTTNTLWWETGGVDSETEADEVVARIRAAYAVIGPRLASLVSRATDIARIEGWDWGQPSPRVPIWSVNLPLPNRASNHVDLPSEVAVVCSFRTAYVPGVNRARSWGRVFLGPVCIPTGNAATNVDTALQTLVRQFGETLMTPIDVGADVMWVQRSETSGQIGPVLTGWVDNAWDTQRRRGLSATSRQVFSELS